MKKCEKEKKGLVVYYKKENWKLCW